MEKLKDKLQKDKILYGIRLSMAEEVGKYDTYDEDYAIHDYMLSLLKFSNEEKNTRPKEGEIKP